MIGTVYRPPARNEHGDPVDQAGNIVRLSGDGVAKVGTISGLIPGGETVRQMNTRGDVVNTDGLIGAPVDDPITLTHGDIVVPLGGIRYRIDGPRLWGDTGFFGFRPTHYWVQATAAVN